MALRLNAIVIFEFDIRFISFRWYCTNKVLWKSFGTYEILIWQSKIVLTNFHKINNYCSKSKSNIPIRISSRDMTRSWIFFEQIKGNLNTSVYKTFKRCFDIDIFLTSYVNVLLAYKIRITEIFKYVKLTFYATHTSSKNYFWFHHNYHKKT